MLGVLGGATMGLEPSPAMGEEETRGRAGRAVEVGWELPWWWRFRPAHHPSPVTHHPSLITRHLSPITHHHPRRWCSPGLSSSMLPTGAIGKLWPELLLSAFNLCLVACKALKRQIVTSTDLLFLLVWKHGISQQPGSCCCAALPH